MFYKNTGYRTYCVDTSNHKAACSARGTVQLIDPAAHYAKMRKSLGSKRQYITEGSNQTSWFASLWPASSNRTEQNLPHRRLRLTAYHRFRTSTAPELQTSAEALPNAGRKALQKLDSAAQQQLMAPCTHGRRQLHRNASSSARLV